MFSTIFPPVFVCWVDVFYLGGFSIVSANIFLMRILLMSVWTELCVCQCLSGELSRCLPEVSPNVFCQICLQEPLDVFQDQPTIFLPVSV